MYLVESDTGAQFFTTRRREAFATATREAKATGRATLYDGLMIEPPTYFELEGRRVRVCHCSAEARLLRAIFGEGHPDVCVFPELAS